MKIIFLDIDGVLNSEKYFNESNEMINNNEKININLPDKEQRLENKMLNIDSNCLNLLVYLINKTNSKVVITSSWKTLDIFMRVCNRLQQYGIPIVGVTVEDGINRGFGIKSYVDNNNIKKYIILDDNVYPDYDEELLSHLIQTSFYQDGLTKEEVYDAIDKLNSHVFVKIRKHY